MGSNILARQEILDHMRRSETKERLFISPLVEAGQVGDTWVELRLGHRFLVSEPSALAEVDVVDLRREGAGVLQNTYREVRVPYGHHFTLHPGKSVQIGTMEYLGIPGDVQGVVTLRASFSTLPLLANAAQLHPGHKGIVMLTLTSNAEYAIQLYPGQRIAELRLEYVSMRVAEPKASRYHGMTRPVPTQLHDDADLEHICPTVEPVIIGIASTIAAGRTTALRHLEGAHGFRRYSLASILRLEANRRAVPLGRNKLQELGTSLRETHGDAYLAIRLRMTQEWLTGKAAIVIVDSFKHPAEVQEFRKQKRFTLLGLDAPCELRWQRIQQRPRPLDPTNWEDFLKQDSIDTGSEAAPHGQQVGRLLGMADKLLVNDGTVQEFLDELDEFVMNLLHPPKGSQG